MALTISAVERWNAGDISAAASRLNNAATQVGSNSVDFNTEMQITSSPDWNAPSAGAAASAAQAMSPVFDNITFGLQQAASSLKSFAQAVETCQQKIQAAKRTITANGPGWELTDAGSLKNPPFKPTSTPVAKMEHTDYNQSLSDANAAAASAKQALAELEKADQQTGQQSELRIRPADIGASPERRLRRRRRHVSRQPRNSSRRLE